MTTTGAAENTIELGDVSVTRVLEWSGPIRTAREIVPESPPALWRQHEQMLVPDFWDPSDDGYLCNVQSWVIRSGGRTIVVDTGVGNDRERPQVPQFAGLRTDFLGSLERAGVRPEDVDLVVNTHIHYDHVGWNTRLHDGGWEPTFPNARYLIPRADFDYFHPDNAHRRPAPVTEADRLRRHGSALVFDDSVRPVHERGLDVLWEGSYEIDSALRIEAAPGHTPGSSALWVTSGGERAVFVGDMLHSPVQMLQPQHNSCFCEDPASARATRRSVLGRAADTRTLVFPAHFPGHGGAVVERDGEAFSVARWAPFART